MGSNIVHLIFMHKNYSRVKFENGKRYKRIWPKDMVDRTYAVLMRGK